MFILFIKDNIAMAKSRVAELNDIDLGIYDSYAEITESDFNTIELPSKKIKGVWTKTKEIPEIEYEVEETERPVSEIDRLRADIDYISIMTGVEL